MVLSRLFGARPLKQFLQTHTRPPGSNTAPAPQEVNHVTPTIRPPWSSHNGSLDGQGHAEGEGNTHGKGTGFCAANRGYCLESLQLTSFLAAGIALLRHRHLFFDQTPTRTFDHVSSHHRDQLPVRPSCCIDLPFPVLRRCFTTSTSSFIRQHAVEDVRDPKYPADSFSRIDYTRVFEEGKEIEENEKQN